MKKKFVVEFEEIVTNEITVEAETMEQAQALIQDGEYDGNHESFIETDRNLRDIVRVKEEVE